jgi:hypothetical protein
VSTQAAPQISFGALQSNMHWPLTQVLGLVHFTPQPPQLVLLVLKSAVGMHWIALFTVHAVSVGAQTGTQALSRQVWAGAPQVPPSLRTQLRPLGAHCVHSPHAMLQQMLPMQ